MSPIKIAEGTDEYSLFRAFTITTLFVLCFGMVWIVHEVQINRQTTYHNRAVGCALLKSSIASNKDDPYVSKIFIDECQTGKVKDLYSNAS